MSGGTKTQTQTTTNEPYKAAQPLINAGLKDAQSLYSAGDSFQPFTGSTVVPYSNQTVAGMTDIQNRAGDAMVNGSPMDDALGFYGNLLEGNGLSADQSSVADMWRKTAGGDELSMISPAFNDVLKRTQDDARTAFDISMSGQGRYGSPGAHGMGVTREVGDLTNRMLVDEYGRQMGRMDAARGNLASIGQQGITNKFGASDALPGAWQNVQMPAQDMMKLGTMYEDLAGRQMADNMRIFEETRDAPMRAIEWINAIGSGAGQFGTSNTASKTPAPNPFLQIGAGLLGGNNLLGNPIGNMLGGGVVPAGLPFF